MTQCKQCGNPVEQPPKCKTRKFCSGTCCQTWWNSHPGEVNRKAIYEIVCACCGKEFKTYGNARQVYCGQQCYWNARKNPIQPRDLTRIVELRALDGSKNELTVTKPNRPAPVIVNERETIIVTGQLWLVSGVTAFSGKIDHFVLKLPGELRERLITLKDIVVFCNGAKDKIAMLQWQSDGFILVYKRLEKGQYPWPKEKGSVVEISRRNFALLLEYPLFLERCTSGDFNYEPALQYTDNAVLF
jgi:hypothetical protein